MLVANWARSTYKPMVLLIPPSQPELRRKRFANSHTFTPVAPRGFEIVRVQHGKPPAAQRFTGFHSSKIIKIRCDEIALSIGTARKQDVRHRFRHHTKTFFALPKSPFCSDLSDILHRRSPGRRRSQTHIRRNSPLEPSINSVIGRALPGKVGRWSNGIPNY